MPKVGSMFDTMTDLRNGLDRHRGHWRRIAKDTAIDYFTIARIARGETKSPRIDTVDKLRGWLSANRKLLAPFPDTQQQQMTQRHFARRQMS